MGISVFFASSSRGMGYGRGMDFLGASAELRGKMDLVILITLLTINVLWYCVTLNQLRALVQRTQKVAT